MKKLKTTNNNTKFEFGKIRWNLVFFCCTEMDCRTFICVSSNSCATDVKINCFQQQQQQEMMTTTAESSNKRTAPSLSGPPLHTAFLSGPLILAIIFGLSSTDLNDTTDKQTHFKNKNDGLNFTYCETWIENSQILSHFFKI